MKDRVLSWLKAGANLTEGAQLFLQIAGPMHPLNRLLQYDTPAIRKILKSTLCQRAGLVLEYVAPGHPQVNAPGHPEVLEGRPTTEPAPSHPEHHTPVTLSGVEGRTERPKLREDFTFLSDPACPPELKILAANKITAYHNYKNGHAKLFDCSTPQEQFAAVKHVVENYIENRRILREFEYYKQHKKLLAEHPVFQELKELRELRKLKLLDLVKLEEKLKHNIWRIKSQIQKKDKPHLDIERERSIREKETKLAEVERILDGYG